MNKKNNYWLEIFQMIGLFFTLIIAVIQLVSLAVDTSNIVFRLIFCIIAVLIFFIDGYLLLYLKSLFFSLPINKNKLSSKGNLFITNTKKQLIMFGRDLSWVKSYRKSIYEAKCRSISVIVVYKVLCEGEEKKEQEKNLSILKKMKIHTIPIRTDLDYRGMISDYKDNNYVKIYFANKVDKKKTDEEQKYKVQEFDHKRYKMLVEAFSNLCKIIIDESDKDQCNTAS